MTPEVWRSLGRVVDRGGRRLFVVDSGPTDSGDAILLLHGFPTSSWDWSPLWSDLSAVHRLVAFDFLGFGFSEKPRRVQLTIAEQADLAEAVARGAGLRRHHLLAHDYGDTVGQELLARDRVRSSPTISSALFLNGGLFPETHRARTIQKLLAGRLGPILTRVLDRAAFGRSFSAVFGPGTQPSEEALDRFWAIVTERGGKRSLHRGLHYIEERRRFRARWVEALVRSRCPVGLINGSMDPVSGAHMVRRYREVVRPDDFIVELPEIGHYPQVEDPQSVLRAYLDFLAPLEAEPY